MLTFAELPSIDAEVTIAQAEGPADGRGGDGRARSDGDVEAARLVRLDQSPPVRTSNESIDAARPVFKETPFPRYAEMINPAISRPVDASSK